MRVDMVDTRAFLNAIGFPAMLVDRDHHVIDANTLMAREAHVDEGGCWFRCFTDFHGTDSHHPDCPLVKAAEQDCIAIQELEDGLHGRLRVAVMPLDLLTAQGERLFLHIAEPVE